MRQLDMKLGIIVVCCIVMTSMNFTAQAQNDFAKLERNVNVKAEGLIHKLNKSKDTLILKSKSLIKNVFSISGNDQREVDLTVNKNDIEIPLHTLSKGKHVFVAVQNSMRVVFVIKILREYSLLMATNQNN